MLCQEDLCWRRSELCSFLQCQRKFSLTSETEILLTDVQHSVIIVLSAIVFTQAIR